jgi:hypothetical protein
LTGCPGVSILDLQVLFSRPQSPPNSTAGTALSFVAAWRTSLDYEANFGEVAFPHWRTKKKQALYQSRYEENLTRKDENGR